MKIALISDELTDSCLKNNANI